MADWERRCAAVAVDCIQRADDETFFIHHLHDIFNPAIADRVVVEYGLTLGQIACAFVQVVYGAGTGRQATRTLAKHKIKTKRNRGRGAAEEN